MVGFGIMDNLIMIQVGEQIDLTFGVSFGLQTMTAAGFGQVISDTAGVCSGRFVEDLAQKLRIGEHHLSKEQKNIPWVARVRTAAMVIGVATGCLIGMTSLLFMDLEKVERLKKIEGMRSMFQTIVEDGHRVMECDRMTLYLVAQDEKEKYLLQYGIAKGGTMKKGGDEMRRAFDEMAGGKDEVTPADVGAFFSKLGFRKEFYADLLPEKNLSYQEWLSYYESTFFSKGLSRQPFHRGGTKEWVLNHGEVLNIPDVYSDRRFDKNRFVDKYTGFRTKSLIVVPVKNKETGAVLGLIELLNKRNKAGEVAAFTESDLAALTMLGGHCAAFLENCGIDDVVDGSSGSKSIYKALGY
jgi:hypothetical protein